MAVLTKKEFYDSQYAPQTEWSRYFNGNNSAHFSSANAPADYNSFLAGQSTYNGNWSGNNKTVPTESSDKNAMLREFDNAYSDYKDAARDAEQKESLAQIQSQENAKTAAAQQIAALAGTGLQNNLQSSNMQFAGGTPNFNEQTGTYNAVAGGIQQLAGGKTDPALLALSAERNYGASPLAAKVNFQVSDDQILNDYNTAKVDRYKRVVELGNTQAVGIQERLTAAQKLLDTLPANSAQRTASDVYVDGLKKDLASVRSAVSDATSKIGSFKPLAVGSTEAAKEITSFRSFLQLPEERATQQLRQIDPNSYDTSVELGKRYRALATEDIGPTKTAQTEQLRGQLEQEAINQLAMGSQLGAEEQRQYQQAARGAQSARGNVFGIGPAVEEAVTTGLAGEQRKLARFGAAQNFLGSGLASGDALKSDIAFRDTLRQNRLGAASNFVAGGPSIYNLANQRTAQQQGAMQQYIQANQALPGQFGQAQSTASPFYQAIDQGIPVSLQNAFASLYGSQADYGARTYGARVSAQAQVDAANSLPNYISAGADVLKGIGSFGGTAGVFACWVAREVYGAENPRWIEFREWMFGDAPKWLSSLYLRFGERIAKFISNKPMLKNIIRKWMDSKIG